MVLWTQSLSLSPQGLKSGGWANVQRRQPSSRAAHFVPRSVAANQRSFGSEKTSNGWTCECARTSGRFLGVSTGLADASRARTDRAAPSLPVRQERATAGFGPACGGATARPVIVTSPPSSLGTGALLNAVGCEAPTSAVEAPSLSFPAAAVATS